MAEPQVEQPQAVSQPFEPQQQPLQASRTWLADLCIAIRKVHDEGAEISTQAFADLMDVVVRIFDYMGSVLLIAKHEMAGKTASLHAVAPTYESLRDVVEADKAAGRATVKDSCARNLHRLVCVIKFTRVMLEQLSSSSTCTVREAANKAYEQSLSPLHIYVVRTAVWAGMYMLPAREHFMQQLGETEVSARAHAISFLECSKSVEHQVLKLFAGLNMPVSTPSSAVLAGMWAGGSAQANTAPAKT